MSTSTRPRWRRRIGLGVAGVLVVLLVGFVVWASLARPAEPTALQAVIDDPDVEVALGDVVEVRPADGDVRRGVVFYPGARVTNEAYVATWAPIVEATDTLVLIPEMPLNLAFFGRSRAADLIADRPGIDRWYVGGHSLGGAMAASWLGDQPPDAVDGLVLWASFATGGAGLDDRDDLEVLSVAGSRDGLATPEDLAQRRALLPDDAVMVEIAGMNHAQFGRYGDQARDLEPDISDAEALAALTDAHVSFFARSADDR